MSDDQLEAGDPSTREYLSLVFLNPVSLAGIGLLIGGAAFLSVFGPESGVPRAELYGGGAMLLGAFVFAAGYSKAQREIVSASPDWSSRKK